MDFTDTGVLTATQDFLPRLSAVDGLVQTAIAAARPQWSLGCDINDPRVTRVDPNHADVLRVFESHPGPGRASIETLIYTITITDVPTADVFTSADPNGIGLVRIDRNATDGIRAFRIENRLPRRTGIDRLPNATAADGHVPVAPVVRVYSNVGNASGHECRSDVTHCQAFESFGVETGRYIGLLIFSCEYQRRHYK